MVTCKLDTVAVSKMNSVRTRKPSSSNSSGFRLLDGDHLETSSSVSRNSVYKLKIDLMFDDTRSIRSHRLDDTRGSQRTRSIIMYGRSELASTAGESSRSIASLLQEPNASAKMLTDSTKKDVQRISNSVQAQIEQLFTDVAKDATSSFAVTCLGSLPLKDKVTSLQGLQTPLRELYLRELSKGAQSLGCLDICATGLRVKFNASSSSNNMSQCSGDESITPFHHIAVWSAVKFVVSEEDGGAAFLPLITDPDNIDKSSLFQPLNAADRLRVAHSSHAPIFAVVMRSAGIPKVLECHGFMCKSTEDAIVIAATLYQSLMAHVSSNSHRSTKRRTPRNQNGVSCVSIASSSAMTGSNYLSRSQVVSGGGGRKSSFRSSNGSIGTPSRSVRKKRASNNSLSSSSNIINEAAETTTEERKRKSHKTKRAPPVPFASSAGSVHGHSAGNCKPVAMPDSSCSHTRVYLESVASGKSSQRAQQHMKSAHGANSIYRVSELASSAAAGGATAGTTAGAGLRSSDTSGDILTRVAIPRSGSFLNTGGLTRYKSRAARRHSGKLGGGGGGSPLGFSELFNEFRLHENLHSLDDILYAIIDADGMSFNDLKPIYKEFLLKLAVTLTKDELFQRSKNIMRRQKKKKKTKRKNNATSPQKKSKKLFFGAKSLKKVFRLGQFRSCRGKPAKSAGNKELETKRKSGTPIIIGPPLQSTHGHHHQHRSRVATSGSDVSVVRHDHTFHGLNRNSSSGYVSCSECSYDSEACTCTSADRCYCSLRTDQANKRDMRRKNERNTVLSKGSGSGGSRKKSQQVDYAADANVQRNSLISCKSDDKCYCSMVEEEEQRLGAAEDASLHTHSDTTWCDTDSCVSASKCYCKRNERHARQHNGGLKLEHNGYSPQCRKTHQDVHKPVDKLAFDYELFAINGSSKSVQPDEALSVKKSVEAAAVFADFKLSQTTDIKSLCPPAVSKADKPPAVSSKSGSDQSCRSQKKKRNHTQRQRDSLSIEHRSEHSLLATHSNNPSQKSCSADDLLSKLSAIEKAVENAASIKSGSSRSRELMQNKYSPNLKNSFKNNYQSMRAVSASLEDTLGYLP